MSESSEDSQINPLLATGGDAEGRKRKRELVAIFFVALLFLILTGLEIRLFNTSQQLPFVHSIFFFGLVNFNIILLLFLLFLIFRNVVKVFVERRSRILGSSLKAKLVAAFVAFSFIPTALLFVTSVFYINFSFEKWFSVKMAGVLKSSLEVTNAYYANAKKRNYHFAHEIADELSQSTARPEKKLRSLRAQYSLDAVEYYPALFAERILVLSDDESIPAIPRASVEFLQKGLKAKVEASAIHQFADGNLVRVIVPVSEKQNHGAVVVTSYVPLSLISKMNDISTAYEEFRDINPLEYPLKSIYMTILFLMTSVILLAATWFGFYLAKQLSIPLTLLGRATRRVAGGDYAPVEVKTGSEEMADLVKNFNWMTSNLAKSEHEVRAHAKYIEVVLASVSAGVISVDKEGRITTINRHAGELLKISPQKYIGHSVRELLTLEYFRTFSEMIKTMQIHKVQSLQREMKINVQGEMIPFLMTLSILKNVDGEEIGKVLVFDDLSAILSAQRAAAWTEVARRIAHEIKNPLTPIKLSAERLQRKFGEEITDPAFQECTSMIIRQTEDLKSLVNEFNQFARLPQAKPMIGSVHKTIEESLALYRSGGPGVEFEFNADPQVPDFKFDPEQIRRALTNIIDNGIAAMENMENKKITITTRYDAELKILRLTVADLGAGIPQEFRSRVFEPYYSTKEGGTGLGLAIVKRIIEDHSGFIRALPNDPQGTKMIIELPVIEIEAWKPGLNSARS